MITLVALVCHMIINITSPVCHEEVVLKEEMSMFSCQMRSQIVVADWKEKSVYSGEQWTVMDIGCVPGDYDPMDSI